MAVVVTEGAVTLAAEDILAVDFTAVVSVVASAGDRWDLLAADLVAAGSAVPDLAACEGALAARQPLSEVRMPADSAGMAATADMDGVAAGSDMDVDLAMVVDSMVMDIPASDTDWATGSGRRSCTEDLAGMGDMADTVATAVMEWVAMAAMDSPGMVDMEATVGMVDTVVVAAPGCAAGMVMALAIERR